MMFSRYVDNNAKKSALIANIPKYSSINMLNGKGRIQGNALEFVVIVQVVSKLNPMPFPNGLEGMTSTVGIEIVIDVGQKRVEWSIHFLGNFKVVVVGIANKFAKIAIIKERNKIVILMKTVMITIYAKDVVLRTLMIDNPKKPLFDNFYPLHLLFYFNK